MKERAAGLYAKHSEEFTAFKNDTIALSNLIDQNPKKVKVEVADRLLEMRALMPGLVESFESLKDYQGDDLDATVADIKAAFQRAETLYTETIARLPETLRPNSE